MKLLFAAILLGSGLAAAAQTSSTLTVAGASLTVQSGATLYVGGSLQSTSGGTLASAGTVQLTGDLLNAGTLASTGTLLFSGSQDQIFTPGAASVSSLTLANTGAGGANRLFISADLTVGNTLTLTQGLVRTQGSAAGSPLATLSMPIGASVVGEADGRYVQGRLRVARAAVGTGTGPVDFTNGLVLDPNGQNLGSVAVTRTAGLRQPGISYGQNVGGTTQGIDRVWEVTTELPPRAAITTTVSWVADDDNGLAPGAAVQLWRADQASGPWAAQGAAGTPATRTFVASASQLPGVLTLSAVSQPLPVTLVAFTAERQGADGLLRWTTASELRNAYFEVESSADGQVFRPLGRVAGAGTTAQAHAYQFTDVGLARYAAPLVYYRLRQVDAGGAATYSPVRAVAVPAAGLALYPNPTHGHTTVQWAAAAGPASLALFDALGRMVRSATMLSGQPYALDLAGLAPGLYVVQVQAGEALATRQLMVE